MRGVDVLANTVKATLGPRGRNVVIWKSHLKTVTKDGVTVAGQVKLDDPYENAGAEMVRQVAFKTAQDAGDGTTTATVLAQAILQEGLKNIAAGANPLDLKKGIDLAVKKVVDFLADMSIELVDGEKEDQQYRQEMLKQVGTISANGDEVIGEMIAEAMHKVGKDGVIYLDTWRKSYTKVEFLDGLQVQAGWLDPQFITNAGKQMAEFVDPIILVYDGKITSIDEIFTFLDEAAKGGKPIIIIAESFDSETLASFIFNKNSGKISGCLINSPVGDNSKDILRDIAVYTGGYFVSEDEGLKLENVGLEALGKCDRVIIAKNFTTFVGGDHEDEEMEGYVADLREQIENLPDQFGKDALKDRIAKLSGGVAVLYVGAPTEVELNEKRDRIDDALHATLAAAAEGIIPGGGVGYIRSVECLVKLKGDNADQDTGIAIVRKALYAPLVHICENATADSGNVVAAQVRNGTGQYGYDAQKDRFGDMVQFGIIDPTKVARVALESAASVAGTILTTAAIIID